MKQLQLKEKQLDTIRAIDEVCPEYWEKHSKDDIRNSLGITLMNYLIEE